MELGTFGAIMGFALELETAAARFYESDSSEVFVQRARAARKRCRRLERARREMVSEMILESISGICSEDYAVAWDLEGAEFTAPGRAEALEDAAIRFYLQAAEKMPIPEAARMLRRMADEHERLRGEGL
jgi:rubrerythrin